MNQRHTHIHTLKTCLKIILARIRCKIGFINVFRTREALVAIQILIQNGLDQQTPILFCSIDYEKASEKIKHDILLRKKSIAYKVLLIKQLCRNQTAYAETVIKVL